MFGEASQMTNPAIVVLVVIDVWVFLAVNVKRWHDRGRSGWWVFVAAVPLIGPIWAIVELGFLRGTVGWNDHGCDPT